MSLKVHGKTIELILSKRMFTFYQSYILIIFLLPFYLFIFLTSECTNLMNLTSFYSLGHPVLKGPDSKLLLPASSTTISCFSLKVESKSYHLQAASKSRIIPWTSRRRSLYPFLLAWQALHTMSSLLWIQSFSQTKMLLSQFSGRSLHSAWRMVNSHQRFFFFKLGYSCFTMLY